MRIAKQATAVAGALMMIGLAAAATPAQAQTPADIARLDRMSEERLRTFPVTQERTPPPTTRRERLHPLDRLWVCLGAEPGQPIYSGPYFTSPTRGVTQDHVATTGASINGFVQVLGYSGRIGYVEARLLGPYQSSVKPGIQCTVEGTRYSDNSPVFGYR